jgi:ribosomal protein S18 acetylase RimI-like enzyme
VTTTIRNLAPGDIDGVVEFSLRAWKPVFESFRQVLGSELYERIYPDWLTSQADAVASVCRDEKMMVSVAEVDGRCVGFVAAFVKDDPTSGEIEMLAVDPDEQQSGIGVELTAHAVEQLRAAGVTVAEVATGGDPGHAPARRTYEKAGFTGLPLVRYYRSL